MHILVVGAGAAGIGAARYLLECGHEVTIIEGRQRIGGRLHTIDVGGQPIDLGASWIEESGWNKEGELNPMMTLAQEYHAVLGSRRSDPIIKRLQEGGEVPPTTWTRGSAAYNRAWKLARANPPPFGILDQSLQDAFDRALTGARLDPIEKRVVDYLCSGTEQYNGAPFRELSNRWYGVGGGFSGHDRLVSSGYGRILEKYAEGIPIILSHVVNRIEYGESGCKVWTVPQNESEVVLFQGDRVIVTLPIGVLKVGKVTFDPPLPTEKLDAIQRVGSGLMDKIVLQFSSCTWSPVSRVCVVTEERGGWRCIMSPFDNHPEIFVCLAAADHAERLEMLSDEEILQEVLTQLQRHLLPPGGPPLPPLAHYHITRWRQDPFSLGSYSFLATNSSPDDFVIISQSVARRIYFAGEHTERHVYASAHGALISGRRAAREVIHDLVVGLGGGKDRVEISESHDGVLEMATRGYISGLRGKGDEIHKVGTWQRTALHWAALAGQTITVQVLLNLGSCPDVLDDSGWTPLQWALVGNHEGCVELLNPVTNPSCNRDIHQLRRHIPTDDLFDICEKGYPIDAIKASINPRSVRAVGKWKRSALHYASLGGHVEAVEVLLEGGADPTVGDRDGWTPLHWAANNSHLNCVRSLLRWGPGVANVRVGLARRTPLDMAKDEEVVALLRTVTAGC